jgi:hypothetical protein
MNFDRRRSYMLDKPKQDEIVRDGQTVRVPIMLMDARQRQIADRKPSQYGHRPGSMPLTDAERVVKVDRQRAYEQKITQRWRNPASGSEPSR